MEHPVQVRASHSLQGESRTALAGTAKTGSSISW